MTRRRFLAFLGLAPVVVPTAIQAAAAAPASTYHPLLATGFVTGEIGRWEGIRIVTSAPLQQEILRG